MKLITSRHKRKIIIIISLITVICVGCILIILFKFMPILNTHPKFKADLLEKYINQNIYDSIDLAEEYSNDYFSLNLLDSGYIDVYEVENENATVFHIDNSFMDKTEYNFQVIKVAFYEKATEYSQVTYEFCKSIGDELFIDGDSDTIVWYETSLVGIDNSPACEFIIQGTYTAIEEDENVDGILVINYTFFSKKDPSIQYWISTEQLIGVNDIEPALKILQSVRENL